MTSPCHSVNKNDVRHVLDVAACLPSPVSCSTPRSERNSKSSRASTEVTDTGEPHDKNSGRINDTDEETVTEEHEVCHERAADHVQSQRLKSEDESPTNNYSHHRRKDKNVTYVDCRSHVDSKPLSERACVKSASGTDTELSDGPVEVAQQQLSLATDVIGPPCGSELSPPLSSYSMYDTVGQSQCGQHEVPEETASRAVSDIDADRIPLPNAQQDLEHRQPEGHKDLLTDDSICCEMSDENYVSAGEQTEPRNGSTASMTVTADVHTRTPASPSLFSADEEDRVCLRSSEAEEESDAVDEEVSSLIKCEKLSTLCLMKWCILYNQSYL